MQAADLSGEDHTRVQVQTMSVQNSWLRGAAQAARILQADDLFSSAEVYWRRSLELALLASERGMMMMTMVQLQTVMLLNSMMILKRVKELG